MADNGEPKSASPKPNPAADDASVLPDTTFTFHLHFQILPCLIRRKRLSRLTEINFIFRSFLANDFPAFMIGVCVFFFFFSDVLPPHIHIGLVILLFFLLLLKKLKVLFRVTGAARGWDCLSFYFTFYVTFSGLNLWPSIVEEIFHKFVLTTLFLCSSSLPVLIKSMPFL